jgi:hypothetical protein
MKAPECLQNFLEQDPLCPVLIMGNVGFFDYEIIPLDDDTDGRNWRPHSGRLSECLGVLGIVDGVSRSALVQPLETQAVDYICKLFAAHVKRRNEIQEAEDAPVPDFDTAPGSSDVAWLRRLWELPDTRG